MKNKKVVHPFHHSLMKFKAQFSLPVNTSYTGKVFELDLPCKPSPGDRIASDDKLFSRHLNAMYKSLDSKIVEGYYDFSFVREIMYKNGETHVIIGIHPSHFLVAFTTDEGMYLCETPVRPVVGDVILDSTVEVRKVHLRSDYLFSIDGTYFDEEAFEDEYDDVDKFDFYDDVEDLGRQLRYDGRQPCKGIRAGKHADMQEQRRGNVRYRLVRCA